MTARTTLLALPLAASLATGCAAERANPEFDDAALLALAEFNVEDPVNLAFALRSLETDLRSYDAQASLLDRSFEPLRLAQDDVSTFEGTPDRDPALCVPVAVLHQSGHGVEDHAGLQMMEDQTPIEPSSPTKYDRFIQEGADCFADRSCEFLRTRNELIKENAAMTIDYVLLKDLRWVDLNLPNPSDVPEGEAAVNEGEARWALAGRSWIEEETSAIDGTSILQSYALELWVPDDVGSLRTMALWSEVDSSLGDDVIAATTRSGIQGIFDAADDFLADGG